MTNQYVEPSDLAALPSYERLLEKRYGAEAIVQDRAEAQATPGLGEPSTALGLGEVAPLFSLPDAHGTTVALAHLLSNGPVVLIFYRGGWCPFCNMYLRTFQLSRLHLQALGAQVLLVSPERAAHSLSLAERQSLLFPMLSDGGNRVARQYGLVFKMPDGLRAAYLADGVDLAERNGDTSWDVPMSATFVITPAGLISYAFVSADYTQRAEPKDVIAVLRQLHHSR
jgi:peroxiredoxin